MRKVILTEDEDVIRLKRINVDNRPIFAKREGVLCGMIICEKRDDEYKWILRTGGKMGACGFQDNIEDCIKKAMEHGFEFFIT